MEKELKMESLVEELELDELESHVGNGKLLTAAQCAALLASCSTGFGCGGGAGMCSSYILYCN
ncbi:hypothetical protein FNE58_21045 [Bacillus thuringiensis]|uniref:sublancin family glycopeptide n=1 Tax=Bacillus thuringiensis TaxID=1428 RepID=UPI000B2D811B|nr:sublancin family glycopeptide [Bacillus thuringiensis]MDR5041913.1 hypothetical protein [Bacillus thuringiensis]